MDITQLSLSRIGDYVGREMSKKLVEEYKVREMISNAEDKKAALVAFAMQFGKHLTKGLFEGTDTDVKIMVNMGESKVKFEFRTMNQENSNENR